MARRPEEILELAETLRERFQERDRRLDIALDYFYNSGLLRQTEETLYRVRVPDISITADVIADLLAAQEIKVAVHPLGESSEAKRRANQLERFFAAWLNYIQREEDLALVHELAYDAICHGALVGRINYRRPQGNGYDGGYSVFPISIQLRSWRYVYPVFRDNRLEAVIEAYPALAGDVKMSFDAKLDYGDNDEVTVYEYWCHDTSAVWIDSPTGRTRGVPTTTQWLRRPAPHGYGCLPYFLRFVRPRSRNRVVPEHMAPSLLQSWLPIVQIINLLESARLSGYLSYVNGAWAVKTMNPDFELDLTAGAVNYLRPEESIEPILRGPVSSDITQATAEWVSRFQRASIPLALYGEVTGITAGYAISLLSDSGRRIIIPIVKAIEAFLSDACCKLVTVANSLLRPLTKEISISAIQGTGFVDKVTLPSVDYVSVSVQLGDPLPRDKERSVNMAVALRTPNKDGVPLLSDETIRDQILGVADNELELRRIIRERMMAAMSGVVLTDVIQEVMAEEGSPETAAAAPPSPAAQTLPPQTPPPMSAPAPPLEQAQVPPQAPRPSIFPPTNDPLVATYLELLNKAEEPKP